MSHIAVILVAVAVGITTADWQLYKKTYSRSYSAENEDFRREIFERNLAEINAHNALHDLKLTSYRMGVNRFTDMTREEIEAERCVRWDSANPIPGTHEFNLDVPIRDLPENVDWRDLGYVTPVKDQMHCGSCWAFSATGAIEGQHFRATQQLVSLSEQDIIDCSVSEGNGRCNGGFIEKAFQDIKTMGGIDTEESYPYLGVNDTCHFKPESVGATVSGFVTLPPGNETALQVAVATIGPVSVYIDASLPSFQRYTCGVYMDDQCASARLGLNHAVLVVGYGTDDDGADYWLVKNSWGPEWGNEGYIKIARNRNNQCGIATGAVYPLV